MYWQHPQVLLALWLLPVVAWLLVRAQSRRRAAAERLVDAQMAGRLLPPAGGSRPWVKMGLILAGLALLIVAGARPRFGVYFEKLTQRGVDLFVLLDVSRSMLAEDVAPNRLQRAKSDIRDLLAHLQGDRVGLTVFAGRPVVKVPLTSDMGFFLSSLEEVGVHSAPRGGSLIGDGIRKCLEAMPPQRDRDQVIVLITDGEDQDSYPLKAAEAAHERGVKIFTVGLGDSHEGARIPVHDTSGRLSYVQDRQGAEHWSKVDEQLLEQIALTTGGAYVPAGTRAYDLGEVYAKNLSGLTRGEYQAEKRKRYREQFQLFVCLGVLLLLAELALARYRRPTRTVAVLLAAWLAVPGAARATDAAAEVRQGIAAYRAGDFAQAAAAFAEADLARPDDPRINFDRATALASQGDAAKATELWHQASVGSDAALSAACHYNLGRAAAEKARALFGEKPEEADPETRQQGLLLLAEAVGHFRDCLQSQPQHADGRYNLELLRQWIKHMQALWAQRDRDKARQELDLLAFLRMLDGRQRALRAAVQATQPEPDSPKRRQAVTTTETAQRDLVEELGPLKDKLHEAIVKSAQAAAGAQPGSAPGSAPNAAAASNPAPPQLTPEQNEAFEALRKLADESGKAMTGAADHLHATRLPEAASAQALAVEKLDAIYRAAVPFPELVGKATGVQSGLVEQATPARSASEGEPASKDGQQDSQPPVEVNLPEAAWQQNFVSGWAEALAPKAKQESEALAAAPAPAAKPDPAAPGQPDAETRQKEQEALKKACDKAIESGPKIHELADSAAKLLEDKQPAEALPKQQEALKLLKEIADLLPKQQQQQQKDGEDQNKGDQQQQPEPKPDEQQQKQQQPQQDLSQSQAEASLRQVNQRQQERQEMEKQLRSRMYRPDPVDKDW